VLENADRMTKKSDCTFLVKNLPANTSNAHLEQLYAPFGDLGRVLVVPGGSLGVVEYQRATEAKKAYLRTSFSNFRGSPLYLQWAPLAVFSSAFVPKEEPASSSDRKEMLNELMDEDEITEGVVSVFIKNLNFNTTKEELKSHIASPGIRSVTIVSKNGQSLGYGFVEFDSKPNAVKAIKQVQGSKVRFLFIYFFFIFFFFCSWPDMSWSCRLLKPEEGQPVPRERKKDDEERKKQKFPKKLPNWWFEMCRLKPPKRSCKSCWEPMERSKVSLSIYFYFIVKKKLFFFCISFAVAVEIRSISSRLLFCGVFLQI
jgi:RNA recognition motif-containing protein